MSLYWRYERINAQSLAEARSGAAKASRDVLDLHDRLDRSLLLCEALWTLMRDRMGVTEEELVTRMQDIDLSDGELDGKVRRPPLKCPKCHRTVARRMHVCLYCQKPLPQDPFGA